MNLDFENINLGATVGDKTGDGARTGGGKINRNFEKVKTFLENPDAILVQKTYALVGQDLTFAAGWVWRINTIEYTNPADVVLNFPLASAGKSRLDLVVLTTSNTFLRVAGAESTTTPVAPATPSGSLYVTVVLVDNTAVGQPQPPEVNGAYVQKSERANVILTGSGIINMLTLADEKATVVFKGSVTRLNTITYPNIPYNGKRITLFNAQNTPVTIGNAVSGYGVDFVFSDGQDYVLQPNQTIEFSFDMTYFPYAHHMFVGGSQTVDQSIIDGSTNPVSGGAVYDKIIEIDDDQIEISGNVTMQPTWNKKTILITGNSTITVPATLLAKYGFPWYLLPGVSLSWAITLPFTWGMTAPTTITGGTEGVYGVVNRRGSTNTIYLGQ